MCKQMLVCAECGCETQDSHYREDENETVCEDCYTEWLAHWMGDEDAG